MKITIKTVLVTAGLLAASGVARAQPTEDDYAYEWQESHLPSGFGIATVLGGGVSGFTESSVKNVTSNVEGLWNLRVTLGSHDTFALDFDYVGTAGSIDVPGASSNTLIGTNFNAALRYNLWPALAITPYAFGGAGYQHYHVTGMTLAPSTGIRDSDTFAVFPLGLGIAYRVDGFVLDARGTLRLASDSNLIVSNTTTGAFASMHTWEASAGAGYEF